ncbi:hypothetical protein [Spirosoma endbachense]|nr:hypothetical protein [Spirosoma endbachense]
MPADWKKLSSIIQQLNYYKDIYNLRYPKNKLGTKDIACSDDDVQSDEFNDKNILLYIEQDTLSTDYDGALKTLFINNGTGINYKTGILDVGNDRRRVIHNPNRVTVKYLMEYDELNGQTLISFQQAIHFDSAYQKQFKVVEYQLIRNENNKHEASIRYENSGTRFYFDVF